MVTSLLDDDQYKFTMQQAIMRVFPTVKVIYKFHNRGETNFRRGFAEELITAVKEMAGRINGLTLEEQLFMSKQRYFTSSYIEYLSHYRFDPDELSISQSFGGKLEITIRGYWYRTILWEVVLMALISELHHKNNNIPDDNEAVMDYKILQLSDLETISYADFGTRRRFSFDNQDMFVEKASNYPNFAGTSNMKLAMDYDIKPIGTQAHEWYMFHAAMYGPRIANSLGLENWQKVYVGDLGTALPDTYTTDVFLKSFNLLHSKAWDGTRQDSGNPFDFKEKMVKHYTDLGINPLSKGIVFSDSINNLDLVYDLERDCQGDINASLGIGTWLSNDIQGVKPLNMVIKLHAVYVIDGWYPAVKLSDTPGKVTGDPQEAEIYRKLLRI